MSDNRHSNSNEYGPRYARVRKRVFQRSGGRCQSCGYVDAVHTHHWAKNGEYPPASAVTSADLIAVCEDCHRAIGLMRTIRKEGLDAAALVAAWRQTTKESLGGHTDAQGLETHENPHP